MNEPNVHRMKRAAMSSKDSFIEVIGANEDPMIAGPGTNPAIVPNFNCTLWNSVIDNTTANNTGQFRESFNSVITISNDYTKANTTNPPTLAGGWSSPQRCSDVHSHHDTAID
jgi:hypothetical protein